MQNAPTAISPGAAPLVPNFAGIEDSAGAPFFPDVGRSGDLDSLPTDDPASRDDGHAASSTAAVIRVFERTPRIDTPRTFSISSRSSSADWCDSTSYPAERNPSTATALMFSSNRTFKQPPRNAELRIISKACRSLSSSADARVQMVAIYSGIIDLADNKATIYSSSSYI